jgi:hypothetical protein
MTMSVTLEKFLRRRQTPFDRIDRPRGRISRETSEAARVSEFERGSIPALA